LKIKEKNRQEIKQSNQFNTWVLPALGGCKLDKIKVKLNKKNPINLVRGFCRSWAVFVLPL
jgi:hypothetical protein